MLEPPSDPPLRRHSTATSGERSASGVSIRQSVKRCLSPGWTKISPADKNNKIKRKQSSPLLVLVQNKTGSFIDNVDNSGSYHSTDIIGSFGKTTSEDQGYEKSNNSPFIKQADAVDPPPPPSPMNTKRKDSDASTTSRQINSDILDTYSSFSPFIYPVPSSTDLSRCSLTSARSYSTSYTSWTKPLVGHSDSCVPGSSILDECGSTAPAEAFGRNSRTPTRKTSIGRFKRDSSADTSKDIDDIDDLELDEAGNEMDLPEVEDEVQDFEDNDLAVIEDGSRKRWSRSMTSPDLAYGSMNMSCAEQPHSV